jgi:hypothetical protein
MMGSKENRIKLMNFFSRWICRTVMVLASISPSAFAQMPNSPPRTAPQPRKKPLAQRGTTNVQPPGPKTKAGKAKEKADKKAKEKAEKEARKRAKKAKKHSK